MPRVIENVKGQPLSEQELRALRGIMEGKSYKVLAAEFKLKPSTVATYIMWVRRKWGVTSSHRGALLHEYINRREAIFARAMALLSDEIGGEFPGRDADNASWDRWRMKCARVLADNDQLRRLM